MFNCALCLTTSQPYEKLTKIVIEKRAKTYQTQDAFGQFKTYSGLETVKEIDVCNSCAEIAKGVIL